MNVSRELHKIRSSGGNYCRFIAAALKKLLFAKLDYGVTKVLTLKCCSGKETAS
jgi:hypothetical protein